MAPSLNTLESQEGNPRAGDRGRSNYAERRKKIISHDNPNANTPTMMAARAIPLPVSPTAVFRNRYDDWTPPTLPMSAGSELMGPAKGKVERPTTENRSEKSARGLVRGTGMPSCAVLCRLVIDVQCARTHGPRCPWPSFSPRWWPPKSAPLGADIQFLISVDRPPL